MHSRTGGLELTRLGCNLRQYSGGLGNKLGVQPPPPPNSPAIQTLPTMLKYNEFKTMHSRTGGLELTPLGRNLRQYSGGSGNK